jgi:DEAD/DEAH box helicase domain-containing protein
LPTLIFPNFRDGEPRDALRFGDLTVVEASLQVHERLSGYVERRGPNKLLASYPLDSSSGCSFDLTRFTRRYFTSGVLFNHPALALPDVERERLAEIVFEAFLMTLPFDRQDVQFGSDQHRTDAFSFKSGDRFLSVYDATYGSLRLTGRLMDPRVIEDVLARSVEIAGQDRYGDLRDVSLDALAAMRDSLQGDVETLRLDAVPVAAEAHRARVILPGSKGLAICHANEEFEIEDVFYAPRGLSYRGVYAGAKPQYGGIGHSACKTIIPVDQLLEIPGESRMGYYDLETGALSE